MQVIHPRPRRSQRQPRTARGGVARRMGAAVAGLLVVGLLLGAAPPNDPLVAQQAHLPAVRAFEAWEVRRGEGAVVAVLDTGVDLAHPDLAGRLVEGIDLVEPGTPPDDPQGHGTIVAGVIAAVAGNGRGVAGVAPQAQVMPIRVLDAQGRGTSDVVAAGIRHAIEAGVQVINLSLAEVERDEDGSPPPPSTGLLGVSLVQDADVVRAIREADEAGILVVAAAGNDGRPRTPYAADTPVLVVGATDADGRMWEDSNHDERTLFAPGVAILSTWNGQRYARSDGTSFATPIVAAGAAMLMGAGIPAADARQRLLDTAVLMEEQEGQTAVGLGFVDLAAAVEGVEPAPPPTDPPSTQAPAGPAPPAATTAAAPAQPPTSSPSGPMEVVEPVQEVTEPVPVVTTPPPPVATVDPATPPTPATAVLEPVEVVVDPSAAPDRPPTAAPTPTPDEGGSARSAGMTLAAMLLGADVLLAGWVLRRRR